MDPIKPSHNSDELTEKQQAFVQETAKGKDGTAAAIAAGYSAKTAAVKASYLLTLPKVQAALDRLRREIATRNQLEQDWVLLRVKAEAEDHSASATQSGRIKALELYSKLQGIFPNEKVEHTGGTTQVIQIVTNHGEADDE